MATGVGLNPRFQPQGRSVDDILERFANGGISRKKAMRLLDVEYGEMIRMMADRNLSLPEAPGDDIDRMAKDFLEVMAKADAARRPRHP
jgi:hypothetical protein